MTVRLPLIHREPANDRERAQLYPETTDLEREAARVATEGVAPMPSETAVVPSQALIPPALAHFSAALSPLLVGASVFLPVPFSVVAFALGYVAAFLGGLPLPQPKFAAAVPAWAVGLVPVFATLATAVAALASTTHQGTLLNVALSLAGIVLAWLAGKFAPAPKQG